MVKKKKERKEMSLIIIVTQSNECDLKATSTDLL
jgi:hypothetical protein